MKIPLISEGTPLELNFQIHGQYMGGLVQVTGLAAYAVVSDFTTVQVLRKVNAEVQLGEGNSYSLESQELLGEYRADDFIGLEDRPLHSSDVIGHPPKSVPSEHYDVDEHPYVSAIRPDVCTDNGVVRKWTFYFHNAPKPRLVLEQGSLSVLLR